MVSIGMGGGLCKLQFIWLLGVSALDACGVLCGRDSNDTSDKKIFFKVNVLCNKKKYYEISTIYECVKKL